MPGLPQYYDADSGDASFECTYPMGWLPSKRSRQSLPTCALNSVLQQRGCGDQAGRWMPDSSRVVDDAIARNAICINTVVAPRAGTRESLVLLLPLWSIRPHCRDGCGSYATRQVYTVFQVDRSGRPVQHSIEPAGRASTASQNQSQECCSSGIHFMTSMTLGINVQPKRVKTQPEK